MYKFERTADRGIGSDADGQAGQPDGEWQEAGNRMLLYLRGLNLPEPQALELALAALETARRSCRSVPAPEPLKEAMAALHDLLNRRHAGVAGCCGLHIPSTPPICRLSMIPERMAPAQWRIRLKLLWARIRPPTKQKEENDRLKKNSSHS